jgi:hypothetical protein
MSTAPGHALFYVISFAAMLTMFASVVGLVWWPCFTVLRASSRGKRLSGD